jgi:predicted 3-demethylubiquinone-9 3-methyltransferase (glyoxalase superfamily)
MPSTQPRITPCLWFDDQAEQAVSFYTSIFPNSKVGAVTRYDKAGAEVSGRPEGSVLTVAFELDGQELTALNGGPVFHFTEALSLIVNCASQDEIDHYWNRLSEGGDSAAQQCGWLKDRYGLSWQIAPTILPELIRDPRGMKAMLSMKKLDIAALRRAVSG